MVRDNQEVLDRLTAAVQNSAKYAGVAESFVRHIGKRELAKGRSFKEAVKATKNKLHQVAGAYLAEDMHYKQGLDAIRAAYERKDDSALREACRAIMRRHASTRERLDFLDRFYTEIFTGCPPIRSVLDVACGLNPLAIPWMPLAVGAQYYAVDIYVEMVQFLSAYLETLEIPGRAWTDDVIESPPIERVDLALILKTIPCLERVDPGAGSRLLNSINARNMLVSFPVQSLGGRDKGMLANYEYRFNELAEGKSWTVQRFEFPSELAFLVSTE
jgi:16S rRNA (guanine(1405)-N(7))-methyltransferase